MGSIAPASVRYNRLTPVARVAGPRCLAGDALLGCVPARLSPVVAMAPGDVCHGPRCSPAGLRPVTLEYRSCHWPGGSSGSPQVVPPLRCGLLRPVPLPPSVRVRVRCPGPPGTCSPATASCVFRGHLALVHQCTCCVRHARSVVCSLDVLRCASGVLGHSAPVHRCARLVCCLASAVSLATWLLFISVHARCVVLRLRRPGQIGSCSLVCTLGVLCCVWGVLGHLAPVHRFTLDVLCCLCGVLGHLAKFTGVHAPCVVLRVRFVRPIGTCSPVCALGVLCCECGVLGHLAQFTAVHARCVVLGLRRPGPLGSCSPVCTLGVLCYVCGILGHLAPVHRCVCSACCVAFAV